MNGYALLVLATLIGNFVLRRLADLLELRALRPELPARLADLYPPDRYRRSQEYARARMAFGVVAASVDLAALLVFWFAGGFGWLDQQVQARSWHPLASGVAYIGALAVAQELLSLPFELYATFGLEERFGFNRTSWRTFWLDRLKGWILGALLGGALLTGLLALLDWAGSSAWLWGWLALILVVLLVQYVAPVWLMPLFNKFTPLPDGELRQAIERYAARVGFPLRGIFVIDGSRRSARANAFFTGFGRNRRIALFDTLVAQHQVPELVAILAHEIGHYKLRHILVGMAVGALQSGVYLFLLGKLVLDPELARAFFVQQPSLHTGLVFFGLLMSPVGLVLGILASALSRRHEYAADRFAVQTTGDPQAFSTALRSLATSNLANVTPHPLKVWLGDSHPPLIDRLDAIAREASANPGRAEPVSD